MAPTDRPGTSSRDPLKLCPCVRLRYVALRDKAEPIGLDTVLIETLRDSNRQSYYMAIGVSWTMRSKHLPQPPNSLALAFDIAPKEYLSEKQWVPGGPLWFVLADIGEGLGLEWGGRWREKDYCHFQLGTCACPKSDVLEA